MSAYGVQWKREGLIPTPTPEWTVEPETDIIRDVVQRYLPRDTAITDVMLYGQGGLNKVYKISTTNLSYALRVSLPLSVPDKVESEVATMTFLAKNISTPIPKVFAYEATSANDIRFPWILMAFLDANPVHQVWLSLSPDQKSHFTLQLAKFTAELNKCRFKGIGALRNFSRTDEAPEPGKFLSLERAYTKIESACRPFRNSHEWLSTSLNDILKFYGNNPFDTFDPLEFEDEDDLLYARRIAQKTIKFVPKLLEVIDQLFVRGTIEETVLSTHDLHPGNIMVDETGTIVGIIDWEFVNTKPLWSACQPPRLLRDESQRHRPEPMDEDGPNLSYDQEMMSWEMYKRYRTEFLDTMAKLDPAWSAIFDAAQAEREIEETFEQMDIGFSGGADDREWIEGLKETLKTRGPLDPLRPVPIEDYESRYYNPWNEVQTPPED